MKKRGLLLIISGPSGSGKGCVVAEARKKHDFFFSVSATTRSPRAGEEDGREYRFITKEAFEKKIAAGEMLEYTFYEGSGQYYGTPKAPVLQALDEGRDVILEIEVDGASKVKKQLPEALLIFVSAPDRDSLYSRLVGRGSETPEKIESRMNRAVEEAGLAGGYDYLIINEENGLEKATEDFLAVVTAESMRINRNPQKIEALQNALRRK